MATDPQPLVGCVTVPGDKSITHRALLLSALAPGPALLSGANLGEDVLTTCRVLSSLGARCQPRPDNHEVKLYGCGWEGLREPEDVLDAGNSGTTLRIGLGLLAGAPGGVAITGDASLRRRPLLRVVAPLRKMGATIDGRRGGDRAPLWVRGGPLQGRDLAIGVPSAQVKSALLLAGLRARGTTSIREPTPTRDHTERMLSSAGVRLEKVGGTLRLEGGQQPFAANRRIPGDLSSAMYLIVAAALIDGSDLEIRDVGLNPTRCGALDLLSAMGADLEVERRDDWGGEPVGRVRVRSAQLEGTEIGPEAVPGLIDELPVLMVAATQARGRTVLRGAGELRIKESDRIDTLVKGLATLGADVAAMPDGLVVRGPTALTSGRVDARGDHRMALSFAVAGLVAGGGVEVAGARSARVSFPQWPEVVAAAQRHSA
jgi:3-phosphoshikimate 1-carboxyvinyltransferase